MIDVIDEVETGLWFVRVDVKVEGDTISDSCMTCTVEKTAEPTMSNDCQENIPFEKGQRTNLISNRVALVLEHTGLEGPT